MRRSNFLQLFTDYKQIQIFILGILSGMPMAIYANISIWMREAGLDSAIITSFIFTKWCYSLKFSWAPLIDHIKIPLLHKLGRRKSWICLLCSLLAITIAGYSKIDPSNSITIMYILTLALGFLSASLDVAIDAFRIDITEKAKLSISAANAVLGYRIGMLIAGAGALYLVDDYGWHMTFLAISCLYVISIVFVLNLKEPDVETKEINSLNIQAWKFMIIDPFLDFFKRNSAFIILLAVIFYKLGDAMLGAVTGIFYIDLGFDKKEIASVTKVFGLFTIILGTYLGGVTVYRYGTIKGLIICGFAQSVTNLIFVWLNHQGHDVNSLIIAIAIENVAAGMGSAALVGYLSYLCNKQFSATQYALLTSLSSLFSNSMAGFGGSILKQIGYDNYFIMTVFLAIPGLILLLYLNKFMENKLHNKKINS